MQYAPQSHGTLLFTEGEYVQGNTFPAVYQSPDKMNSFGMEMPMQMMGDSNGAKVDAEEGPTVAPDFSMHKQPLRGLLENRDLFDAKESTAVWSSRMTYILAAVGSAVGLGNIWRFPYLCYRNGGGAFLIPYFISLFTLAVPAFMLETSVGQGTGKSALGAFKELSPRSQGLGFVCFCSTTSIALYYNVILCWCLRYVLSSLAAIPTGVLPWSEGNSSAYFQGEVLNLAWICTPKEGTTASCPTGILSYADMQTASLGDCSCAPGGIDYPGAFNNYNVLLLFILWGVILAMCCFGTRSLKYAVYITVPLPYIMLILLFIRGVTLPGSQIGIDYYLKPDVSRLFVDKVDEVTGEVSSAASVWIQAVTQTFFSLSLSEGAMITYASYNPPSFPIARNVMTVALINSATEFFAGFCVFAILGYLSDVRGVPIDQVVAAGPGLVFEVIPTALAMMPAPVLMSFLFFIMLLLLGLTSAVSLVESANGILRDALAPLPSDHVAVKFFVQKIWSLPLITCFMLFLIGTAFCKQNSVNAIDVVDYYISNFSLTLVCIAQFLVIGWVFGADNFSTLMEHRLGWSVPRPLALAWRYFGPLVLTIILIAGVVGSFQSPIVPEGWAQFIGWVVGVGPFLVFVGIFLVYPRWYPSEPETESDSELKPVPVYFPYPVNNMSPEYQQQPQMMYPGSVQPMMMMQPGYSMPPQSMQPQYMTQQGPPMMLQQPMSPGM